MPSPAEDRARALAVAQNFGPEALDLNRRLVAVNGGDLGSRTRLARCYLEAGRLDEAEVEYRTVLRADPRNRIAAGGLETIAQQRRERETPPEKVRGRRPRAPRDGRASQVTAGRRQTGAGRLLTPSFGPEPSEPETSDPVPQTFTGFGPDAFTELAACRRRAAQARFAPRVIDLLRRVNALGSSVEIAGIREPGKRQLFRLRGADVRAGDAHWHVLSSGACGEPQWDIGMYAGPRIGNWLRIGIGFDLGDTTVDRDASAGAAFRLFQELITLPRGSLFLGWMVKEDGSIQIDEAAPRLDVREPSQAAGLIASADPERVEWVFFGKWLRPETAEDAAVLSDPLALVRTIDRVFTGLLPLFRAVHEPRA